MEPPASGLTPKLRRHLSGGRDEAGRLAAQMDFHSLSVMNEPHSAFLKLVAGLLSLLLDWTFGHYGPVSCRISVWLRVTAPSLERQLVGQLSSQTPLNCNLTQPNCVQPSAPLKSFT